MTANKNPQLRGFLKRMKGTRTLDLLHGEDVAELPPDGLGRHSVLLTHLSSTRPSQSTSQIRAAVDRRQVRW
jgi:hypothetical protein